MAGSSPPPDFRRAHLRRLTRASLRYFRAAHAAVALGVIVGTATLTGALFVGDSMRGSLRDAALKRLGEVYYALITPNFVRHELADSVAASLKKNSGLATGMISMSVAAVNPQTRARFGNVILWGVDSALWQMNHWSGSPPTTGEGIISEKIAKKLGASIGDDVLLRLQRPQSAPVDSLLGRRDELGQSLRLKVSRLISDDEGGAFAVRPGQGQSGSVFVNLGDLQKTLKQPGHINVIAVDGPVYGTEAGRLDEIIAGAVSLEDYSLKLQKDETEPAAAVESKQLLIPSAAETAISEAAQAVGAEATPTLVYVLNEIATGGSTAKVIPYSTACAMSPARGLTLIDGSPAPVLGDNEMLLNQWAAEDLAAKPGDTLRVKYFVSRPYGRLEEVESSLTLKGVVAMSGLGADASLTPAYEGITDTKRISDWNPPFPMDMKRIRPKDEAYWDKYKAAPKAFVSPATGLKLWAEQEPRYGRYTSIRVTPPQGTSAADFATKLQREILARLSPESMGLKFQDVRAEALAAAGGSTDFGELFLGFSFFLILSAAMLVALLFRLNMERRGKEIGLLLALGWPPRVVRGRLMREGAMIAGIGSVLGGAAAFGFAWLMIEGLKTWWTGIGDAPPMKLHASTMSLLIGIVSSFIIALISIRWSMRSLMRSSAVRLLSGEVASHSAAAPRGRVPLYVATIAGLVGLASLGAPFLSSRIAQPMAFFLGGAALLIAGMASSRALLLRKRRGLVTHPGMAAMMRIGVRSAARNPGRSTLVLGLTACASFIIVVVAANRVTVDQDAMGKTGGCGGFQLIGQSVVPIAYDLNRPEGRKALGLSAETSGLLGSATVMSFRVQGGDDTSCLNLYQVARPGILGATPEMIARGGFAFSSVMTATHEEAANPWRLLDRSFPDGAVPCIGDANTVLWLLHSGVGSDFTVPDERGRPTKLRFVALLSGSVLQSELVISEKRFVQLFSSVAGYGAFMIDCPANQVTPLKSALERELTDNGLELESTRERLARYLSVENTYLAAFQTLGGLGFVLGACGLAIVMLRNALERRREFALLRAVGYSQRALGWMVFAENSGLLAGGLFVGTAAALIAVAPHALRSGAPFPVGSLTLTLGMVLVSGLAAIGLTLRSAVRAPLLEGLRRE